MSEQPKVVSGVCVANSKDETERVRPRTQGNIPRPLGRNRTAKAVLGPGLALGYDTFHFIADGLKPLTNSHIARTNSFKTIGSFKIISSEIIPVTSNRFTIINNMAAITPHTDIHRGMSFD